MTHASYTQELREFEFHKRNAERTHSTQSLLNTTVAMEDHSLTSLYSFTGRAALASVSAPVLLDHSMRMDYEEAADVTMPPKMSM